MMLGSCKIFSSQQFHNLNSSQEILVLTSFVFLSERIHLYYQFLDISCFVFIPALQSGFWWIHCVCAWVYLLPVYPCWAVTSVLKAWELPGVCVNSSLIQLKAAARRSGTHGLSLGSSAAHVSHSYFHPSVALVQPPLILQTTVLGGLF